MKWAIREAVDVYFKAKSAFKLGARTFRIGEPVLIFDTVKTGTQEVASEMSYVTGGRGNNRLLSFEGDKTMTFNFEDALLSAEGLAILAGADLIPARNKHLNGASPEARSVISHYTEKYSVATNNRPDAYEGTETANPRNIYPDDASLGSSNLKPRGGKDNVWLTRKPYVGQNGSIYVMLLDDAGEISGAPIEINLSTDGELPKNPGVENRPASVSYEKDGETIVLYAGTADPTKNEYLAVMAAKAEGKITLTSTEEGKWETWRKYIYKVVSDERFNSTLYLRKFVAGDQFVAFDNAGLPIKTTTADPVGANAAAFDDGVAHYVDFESANRNWVAGWGLISSYTRTIPANAIYSPNWASDDSAAPYCYLLQPSGGVAQPKCFKEGTQFVYKVNVPSILYQDIVLIDYYVEYRHDATQVSILPDKFAPYMYVEGSSLVRRASDGMDLPVEFVIPKFKIKTAISFTFQSTGDASTFNFQGDAYPDFSKFDLTRKVLADIQILDADDNYDGATGVTNSDPTSYRRFKYNEDQEGDYLWKDPAIEAHSNIDYSDAGYEQDKGGPASVNEDSENNGRIWHE